MHRAPGSRVRRRRMNARRLRGLSGMLGPGGYKLGVQSSSDHISMHTSYACVLAQEFTRQGILDPVRKRHTYAATNNIVMDFSGSRIRRRVER
jgi:hypothetical protein